MDKNLRGLDWAEVFRAHGHSCENGFADFDDWRGTLKVEMVPTIREFLLLFLQADTSMGAAPLAHNDLTNKIAQVMIDHESDEEVYRAFQAMGDAFWH